MLAKTINRICRVQCYLVFRGLIALYYALAYWAALSLSFRLMLMNIIAWGPQVSTGQYSSGNSILMFT